jgi:hypothetical protein
MRALANRPVRPPAVEIADIFSQHMSQMALAENKHEIQTPALTVLIHRSAMALA